MTDTAPKPPRGLSARSRRLWTEVLDPEDGWSMHAGELAVFEQALRALDLADEAAKDVARDGMTVRDRYGSPKAHPLLDVVSRNRQIFAKLVHQLGLELGENETPTTIRARRAANSRWSREHG